MEEKKQILSEYPTWKFAFFYVTPKQFSSIKVGLCIFFNLDSFKTKENDLKIHLYGLLYRLSYPVQNITGNMFAKYFFQFIFICK